MFLISKNGRYVSGTIAFIIVCFLLMKTCSTSTPTKRTFHIGSDNNWNILNLMGKEKNLGAFVDELLTNIANQQKIRITLSYGRYEELLTDLEERLFDGILSNIQPDSASEHSLVFSEPFLLLGPVLVVPLTSKLNNWEELKYKIIGIQSQSPSIFEFTQDSSILIRLYDNILTALEDLDKGRIDGVILPVWPAYIYTRSFFQNRLKVATTPLSKEGLRLIGMKNQNGKDLIEHFNKGLEELKKNGTYDKLVTKWGLVNPENLAK